MPRYSQNFLVNGKIADYIVEQAELHPEDTVLEIGPGRGILTERLIKRGKVIAVEIDNELCDLLQFKFENEIKEKKLKLICGDALKIEFPQFTKVVANIPYHISSPLIFKILSYEFKEGLITVQKEFGERLVAEPGTKKYGRLSVMAYYYGDAKLIKIVKRGNFRPVPKVDSVIVKIVKHERFCYKREVVEEAVRKMFSQRRKKIKNVFGDVPFGEKRAEELTPEEICEVSKHVDRIRN